MYDINKDNFLSFSSLLEEFKNTYNESIILDLNTSHIIDNSYKFDNLDINVFNSLSLDSLVELSTIKSEVDELTKILPSMDEDIELLDL
jgi:hypothetical protein